MEIREATAEDTATVLAFIQAKAQFDRELGAFSGSIDNTEELIGRHLFGSRPAAFVQLAVDGGEPTGFALYYFRYSSFRGRPNLWLDDLYVHPGSRRQSAGQGLMRRLAERAVAADCTHIAWIASASNRIGMTFYAKIGTTIVSQTDDTVALQIDPRFLLETK